MFCPECGKQNPDEMKFCTQCGSALIDNSQQQVGNTGKKTTGFRRKADATANKLKANSKKVIVLLGIILAVVVVLGSVGSAITTPEYVAKQYFKGIVEKDWDKVYGLMSIEQSEFVSKEGFVRLMENQENEIGDVESYEVRKNRGNFGMKKMYGESSYKSNVSKTVIIDYVGRDSQDERSTAVYLVKQKNKKFLFFDNYKVSSNELIANDFKIYAAPIAKIAVDGIPLSDEYITGTDEYNCIEYEIPQIFGGEHEISVTGDIIEDEVREVYVSGGDSCIIRDLKLNESELNGLIAESEKIFREFVSSALENKDFSELNIPFTDDRDELENIKNYYQSIVDSSVKRQGYGLENVYFRSFIDNGTSAELSDNNTVSCRLSYSYDTSSVYKNYLDELENRTSSYTRNDTLRIDYQYENNEYVVKSISGRIYY